MPSAKFSTATAGRCVMAAGTKTAAWGERPSEGTASWAAGVLSIHAAMQSAEDGGRALSEWVGSAFSKIRVIRVGGCRAPPKSDFPLMITPARSACSVRQDSRYGHV
jgi:hypothetical protein